MDDLYRQNILDHYKQPRNFGELPDADLEFEDNNPLCGDELKVQLKVEDGRVADERFSGHGCAISQASASMASEELVGMPMDDLMRLDREFILDLLGIDISATRMPLTSSEAIEAAACEIAQPCPEKRRSATRRSPSSAICTRSSSPQSGLLSSNSRSGADSSGAGGDQL